MSTLATLVMASTLLAQPPGATAPPAGLLDIVVNLQGLSIAIKELSAKVTVPLDAVAKGANGMLAEVQGAVADLRKVIADARNASPGVVQWANILAGVIACWFLHHLAAWRRQAASQP